MNVIETDINGTKYIKIIHGRDVVTVPVLSRSKQRKCRHKWMIVLNPVSRWAQGCYCCGALARG